MRILLVMDPGILVPPKGYGGHERLVYMFAREYARLGHEVHLLVTENSEVPGCTVHTIGKEGFPAGKDERRRAMFRAWRFLWKHRNGFDLVHNFGRLLYLLPVLNHPVKKIMTYGREISRRNIQYINKLPNRNLLFTGCSRDLVSRGAAAGRWKAVYNAIVFDQYTLVKETAADAPLMFLGRIERVKGCHTAISVAKATNHTLIIAGNVSPLADEQAYFKQEVEPYIDGKQIIHVGAVNDGQKNYWLGKSKALLFPIEWNEPFGMVMPEAMACGTPVIGFKKGSVAEVVEDGITGFAVNNQTEMIDALSAIHTIDRSLCRARAASRFDIKIVALEYLQGFSA